MELIFILVALIFIWGIGGDINSWLEDRKFRKKIEESKNDTSIEDYLAKIATLPSPWLGMHESELSECNWTEHYTSYSKSTTKHGTNCCYFYNGIGYLHFANKKLVSIVTTG